MVGFLIAVLSGVLMSVQGIFNTQVTKASSIWSANVFVQATALLSFLNGDVDEVTLVSEDMEKYSGSSYIDYTPQSHTTKLTINSDYDALKKRETAGINKTMLTVRDFRKAISYAIDRQEFASKYTAAGAAGFGLLNSMYIFDPEASTPYRLSLIHI